MELQIFDGIEFRKGTKDRQILVIFLEQTSWLSRKIDAIFSRKIIQLLLRKKRNQ